MGQSCYHNSTTPESDVKLNNNVPEQYSHRNQSDTLAINQQSYQTRINELENNVQISLETMNKLNTTIQNLVVQVEELNKQLDQKQQLQQNETQEQK
ncbi:unnamed protein product [Paramecium pentaurelia]|uniref:Uncharacterized protein n=1 Tax=Paramecium pentaurelia TaxID=43138 RepID=A0A8S1SG64_9CILI|nr:unnamed protein product [Paramecium pentaurelia]